eukprot:1508146-Pyramimonas_sp.AAC.1
MSSATQVTQDKLQLLVGAAKKIAARCRARALRASLAEFKGWMDVPTAAGVLHKAMRQDPVPSEEIIQGATVVFQPRD